MEEKQTESVYNFKIGFFGESYTCFSTQELIDFILSESRNLFLNEQKIFFIKYLGERRKSLKSDPIIIKL